jgi:hypothetical protein
VVIAQSTPRLLAHKKSPGTTMHVEQLRDHLEKPYFCVRLRGGGGGASTLAIEKCREASDGEERKRASNPRPLFACAPVRP